MYKGLSIKMLKGDSKMYPSLYCRYALNLMQMQPLEISQSSVQYKHTFTGSESEMTLLWTDFKPFYRGRPVDAPPLTAKTISGISFMMQSFFDKQSGPFALEIQQINLIK